MVTPMLQPKHTHTHTHTHIHTHTRTHAHTHTHTCHFPIRSDRSCHVGHITFRNIVYFTESPEEP